MGKGHPGTDHPAGRRLGRIRPGLIVITLEQIMPYQWDIEFGVKKIIYDAIIKKLSQYCYAA